MEKSINYSANVSFAEETTNGRSKCGVTLESISTPELDEKGTPKTDKDGNIIMKAVSSIKVIAKSVEVDGNGITLSWKAIAKAMASNRQMRLIGVKTANQPQRSSTAKGIICALMTGAKIEFVREFYKVGETNPDTNTPLTEPYWRTIIKTIAPASFDNNDFAMLFSDIKVDCDAKGLPMAQTTGLMFMQ